ncbi:hypothetical protein BVC71_04060 [Marivivens niveibacter]|uniref:DUF3445 domain-containing protein n=2 Tax=Marivivens niveibacter TaxID=1930667 RepID=A0A251X1R7_9RHOB|nr:hypothetical protein BVC71_04060 [Marivivens niveibacter]
MILQSMIPVDQREAATARLPAMKPVQGSWITIDDAYSAQMAEKARLMTQNRQAVCRMTVGAEPAVGELLDYVLEEIAGLSGFERDGDRITRPDGMQIDILRDDPFLSLSQLVTEDLCVLEKRGDEHVLTAALLCFPAAWTLAEKIGRPLTRIHVPVAPYNENIARRVQRLFDGIQPNKPIWRANLHTYEEPDLFHVRGENDPRPYKNIDAHYERSERQTVLRLPNSGAVLFAIHTCVVALP